jgi:hypothetical protein
LNRPAFRGVPRHDGVMLSRWGIEFVHADLAPLSNQACDIGRAAPVTLLHLPVSLDRSTVGVEHGHVRFVDLGEDGDRCHRCRRSVCRVHNVRQLIGNLDRAVLTNLVSSRG